MADEFKACSVDGCNGNADRSHYGRAGFCSAHYRQSMTRTCSIEGCDNRYKGHGFCDKHYQRLKKHGSPFVTINTPRGEPRAFLEEVVLPYDGDECLLWPFSKSADGYAKIVWEGKHSTTTRIICEMMYGHPGDGYHAAHSCGNGMKGCVTKRHLSWKTEAENQAEKFIHGTVLRGEDNPPAKLTSAQVLDIFSMKGKMTYSQLASKYGVAKSTIGGILTGQKWKWLTSSSSTS